MAAHIVSLESNSLKFSNGNVFVVLDVNDDDYWLQVHEAVIQHKSVKIERMLSTEPEQLDPKRQYLTGSCKIPFGVRKVLTLQDDGEQGEIPTLTSKIPPIEAQDSSTIKQEEKGTAEGIEGLPKGVFSAGPNVSKFKDTFKSLFAAFYDEPLRIADNDIRAALEQSEDLVKVATTLHAVPAIRAQVSNVLQEYRQKMYVAIKDDPPRWLNLALALECAPIFSEAIIHIIGCWPDWLWDTPKETLAPALIKLADQKAKLLEAQRLQVDRKLLVNSIIFGEDDRERPASLKETPDAWLAVGVFRDWLVKELNSSPKPSEVGRLYRSLLRGGEAYLTDTEVYPTVDWVGSNLDPDSIIQDLKLLKNFASKAVENICENGLMVSPEALNLGYLTCVDVRPIDYPW